MKLKESVLTRNVETSFSSTGFEVPAEYVPSIMESIVESASDKLRETKNKEKTALIFKDSKDNFMIAAVVDYHENPEEGQDNYNYYWTFDKEDVENAHVYYSSDDSYKALLDQRLKQTHGIKVSQKSLVMEKIFMQLIDYMRANAKEGEEFTLEDDGYFVVTSGVEDGKVVMSFLPDGPMKMLIKDDATVEA